MVKYIGHSLYCYIKVKGERVGNDKNSMENKMDTIFKFCNETNLLKI